MLFLDYHSVAALATSKFINLGEFIFTTNSFFVNMFYIKYFKPKFWISLMKKIACTILSLLSLGAYADEQASLNQLQAEINALNAQVQNKQMAMSSVVGLDTINPLGLMSKVQMPVYMLRAKDQLSNPIVVGAQFEADAQYTAGNTLPIKGGTTYGNGSDIALSKIEPFIMSNINSETTGMFAFKNSLPITNPPVMSRVFLIFGNLDKSHWSLTTGATYLPFGNFAGNGLWDNALTTNLFRSALTDQVDVNYSNQWLIANAGGYSAGVVGATEVAFLANAIAQKTWHGMGMSLGTGYLSDVRGTNDSFGGAYALSGSSSLSQPLTGGTNPAYDISASFGPAYLTALSEFVTTGHGAQSLGQHVGTMNAWMLGEQSKLKIRGIYTQFQLSYSKTDNMNNIPMPFAGDIAQNLKTAVGIQHQWLGSVTGEFWNNIFIGPEFDYQHLYTGQRAYTTTLDVTAYL